MPTPLQAQTPVSVKEVEKVVAETAQKTDQLIAQFAATGDADIKAAIIHALGELRSPKAVNLLIENIQFGAREQSKGLPKYGSEPAVTALAKIGIPAVAPVLRKLKEEMSPFTRGLFVNTLVNIHQAPVATYVLKLEVEKETNPTAAAKLKESIAVIERYYRR